MKHIIFLWAAILSNLTAVGDEPFQVRLIPSGDLGLEYTSSVESYFVLEKSVDIGGPFNPLAVQSGKDRTQLFLVPQEEGDSNFYRVRQVDSAFPLDLDGDGIDDLYELENGLDPLDPADALQDLDGDGNSVIEDYLAYKATEEREESSGPQLVVTQKSYQGVVIEPGSTDIVGRGIVNNSPYVSMNDSGTIVFRGEWNDAGTTRRNIFSYIPKTSTLRPLLNTAPDFELPYRADNSAPSQDFSVPMIDNSGRVLVARRLNALVQIGFPFGQILNAPLTHLEVYSADGNPTPGRRDLPIDCLVSGELGVGSVAGLLFWLNPVTAGLYPCPFDPFSPWEAIHYRRSDGFPVFNNYGEAVFSALRGGNHLTTLALPSVANSLSLGSGRNPHPVIDDSGLIATVLDRGNGKTELIALQFDDFSVPTVVASESAGYTAIGFNCAISDDGTTLIFLSDYNGSPEGGTSGPGLFVLSDPEGLSIETILTRRPRRISGIAENGVLEPGEQFVDLDKDGVVDAGEDRGLIFGYRPDGRVEVNNQGIVSTIGKDSSGRWGIFAFALSDKDEPRPGPTAVIATVGEEIDGHMADNVELYNGLANTGEIAFTLSTSGKIATKTLVPFEIIPDVEAKVSADDGYTYIVLQIGDGDLDGAGPPDLEGAVAEWRIAEGSGGTLDQSETTFEDGYSTIRLSTARVSGSRYVVEARLKAFADGSEVSDAPWVKSGEILVTAGAAQKIKLESSSSSYSADGASILKFSAEIRDQFGNLVEDGTGVRWSVTPSQLGSFPSGLGTTVSGQAFATLVAPMIPGLQKVSVYSENAQAEVDIVAGELHGTLSGKFNLDLCSGETSLISAAFNASDGTVVNWYTSNGSITEKSFVQGGVARAVLNSTGGRLGKAYISATAGSKLVYSTGIFGCPSGGLAMGAVRPVILGTETENGTVAQEFGMGRVRDIPYFARSEVDVSGPPNARVAVDVSGVRALAEWLFEEESGGATPDSVSSIPMIINAAKIERSDSRSGVGSLLLDGLGYGTIPNNSKFDFQKSFSASMWIRTDSHTDAVLIRKGDAWSLKCAVNGLVTFEVSTDQGVYAVSSAVPVPLELWTRVEARFGDSEVSLRINGVTYTASASGELLVNSAGMDIGLGIVGSVDDLRFDGFTDPEQIVTVVGLDAGSTLTLDSEGRGRFEIASNGNSTENVLLELTGRVVDLEESRVGRHGPGQSVARTSVAVVKDPKEWVYTVDAFSGFVGGDTETGAGFASGIVGGVLGIADVGALGKNGYRIVFRAFGYATKDPNYLEALFSGVGLITTISSPTGIGAVADVGVSACRQIATTLGDAPPVREMLGTVLSRIVDGVRRLDVTELQDTGRFLGNLADNPLAAKSFSSFLHDDTLVRISERAFKEVGGSFTTVVSRNVDEFGPLIGSRFVQVFDGLGDDAYRALKGLPAHELDEALEGLGRLVVKEVSPADLTRMLNNRAIFTTGYERGHLLRDFGLLANAGVGGLELSVRLLKSRAVQSLGFRYEVEGAAHLMRSGKNVIELSRKVAQTGSRRIATDIDVVVMDSSMRLVYYQFKRSEAALRSNFNREGKGLMGWINKALADLMRRGGEVSYSQIKIAIPPGTKIPKAVAERLKALPGGIEAFIEYIPHG